MAREPARDDDRPPDEGAVRKPFLLRLSPEVFDALRGWSAQEMRSVNGHIEYLLRKALAERQSTKGKR
jgi:hypothetical protein